MNNPELELLIKEKMQKYLPHRSIQVMHCGVIVLVSFAIGIFNLPSEPIPAGVNPDTVHQGFGAWFGVYLAISGLAIYFIWTYLRAAKARKEAHAEFLAAPLKK
jgi:hypothetical protein